MNKFQAWLNNVMRGRYGNDSLNQAISIVAIVLWIINFIVKNNILQTVVLVLMILTIVRSFSKKWAKRNAENQKYLNATMPIRRYFKVVKRNFDDKGYKYFLCPTCKTMVRIPRGRGKVEIKCPNCQRKFDRKS